MTEPFLGEIRAFAFNFAPVGWAACSGQLLPINQNTALFSLLGTNYGGDGISTFALPNLNGRVVIGMNSSHPIGETGGEESHTLSQSELPPHTHGQPGSSALETTDRTPDAVPAAGGQYATNPDTAMAPTGITGGGLPHNNMQPYLSINYCIAMQGIFPSRS